MLTLGAAAQHTGRSKATISRAISSGRLTASRREGPKGGWQIDPAELNRVYPINSFNNHQMKGDATAAAPVAELVALRERVAEQSETIRDLRSRLDASETERRADKLLLVAERQEGARRPLWRRLFGG